MRTMFTPLKIAGMEVKNRTFMAPMSLGYESQDGTVNEKMEAYWLRRAQGGVGCIIVDATSVDPNVPYLGNTLCFRDEESIKKYKSFTDKVHSYGCKIIEKKFSQQNKVLGNIEKFAENQGLQTFFFKEKVS